MELSTCELRTSEVRSWLGSGRSAGMEGWWLGAVGTGCEVRELRARWPGFVGRG